MQIDKTDKIKFYILFKQYIMIHMYAEMEKLNGNISV